MLKVLINKVVAFVMLKVPRLIGIGSGGKTIRRVWYTKARLTVGFTKLMSEILDFLGR